MPCVDQTPAGNSEEVHNMPADHLLFEKKDNIATITLNRPGIMNAMSAEMVTALYEAVLQLRTDSDTRIAIFRGAGEHFCSGADISLFDEKTPSREWLAAMKMVSQIVRTIREIPQPVITMMRGVAVGAGSNLALASDFVVAADNARFCEIFINIGAIVDYGGHYFLPRLVGLAKARELAMLGNEIDGKTAASMGLIYKSVPEATLEKEVGALVGQLLQKSAFALALIKEGLEKSFDRSLAEVLDWEASHQSIALKTPQHQEIIKAFKKLKGIQ
jgi:enoyl-CoA hydratase/2-(1,2-epoxy-1,2-dihydrophenyl)acetyl-CoA isomerase